MMKEYKSPFTIGKVLKDKNTYQRKGELHFMSDKIIENNQVTVIGSVASEFTYSHEVFGEGFYMVDILVKRLSKFQ